MKKTTKLLPLLLVFAIYFNSCKSDKEILTETPSESRDMIVKSKLEKNIKSKLQYPESYKFAELTLRDSVLYSDNVEHIKNHYQRVLNADKENVTRQESYKAKGSSKFNKENLEELQSTIAKNERILLEIDKLSKDLGDKVNETASYTYNYAFKSKNISGKDASYNYIVQTSHSPEYKLLSLAEREDMIMEYPNEFPGYKEMIASLK